MENIFPFRDQRDGRYVREKISHRQAKDVLESMVKLEQEFKHLFNGKIYKLVYNDDFCLEQMVLKT